MSHHMHLVGHSLRDRVKAALDGLSNIAAVIFWCWVFCFPSANAQPVRGQWEPAVIGGTTLRFDVAYDACLYSYHSIYPEYEDKLDHINQDQVNINCYFQANHNNPAWLLQGGATLRCPPGTLPSGTPPYCVTTEDSPHDHVGGCPGGFVGNPIDVAMGAKIERKLDFSTQDGRLYFLRSYSPTQDDTGYSFPLGMRWWSNFDRQVTVESLGTYLSIQRGDGRVARFAINGSNYYRAIPNYTYVGNASGGYIWGWNRRWSGSQYTQRSDVSWKFEAVTGGYKFTDVDGTIENYDSNKRITSIQFRGGYSWSYSYNSAGRYTSVTDSLGRSVLFTYDARGLMDSVTDPDGKVYRFEYANLTTPASAVSSFRDPFAHLAAVIYPDDTVSTTDNPRITYHYENTDFPVNLTGITDERGVRLSTWAYDDYSRGTQTVHAGGADQFNLSYTGLGGTTAVTNPLGRVTTYLTPLSGQYIRHISQMSSAATAHTAAATTNYGYDANGYLNQVTDAEGRITKYVRDSRGLETSRTEAFGTAQARTITTSWHASYDVPTQIVEPGLTTNATYDTNSNLTQLQLLDTTSQSVPYSTNGQQRVWNYTYTAAGLLDTVDGPLAGSSDLTDYDYDASGNLIKITDALGHITLVTSVDGAGRPLSVIDPNGVVTALAYTPRGWLSSITVNPGGSQRQTSFAYDNAGHVTQVTLPNGGTLSYTYDDAGRVTEARNNFNDHITYAYNANSQVTQRQILTGSNTLRFTMAQAYDEIGRLMQTIGAASQTEARAYDRTDNLTSITDPRSHTWSRGYDALQRLTSETNPDSQSDQYGYDGRDNLASQTDGRSLQTTFVRNGFGDVIKETSPDGGATTYWYDAPGNVSKIVDADSVEVDFTYDVANRLTQKTYPGSTSLNQTFAYDDVTGGNSGKDHVTSASDAYGVRTFIYDQFGELTRETRTINSHSYQTDYAYNAGGQLTQVTYPSGRQVRYTRDAQDRITAVETRPASSGSWSSIASNVSWRPFGPLEGLDYGNDLHLAIGYDQNYWLTSIAVNGGSTATLDIAYGRDAAGAVASMTDAVNASRSATYSYTNSGRLASATTSALATSWTYDAAGNRTRETRGAVYDNYTYPSTSNRLTETRDQTSALLRGFTYRSNGAMLTEARTGTGTFNYDYDATGRMTQVRLNSSVIATYGYDSAGRRITRNVSGTPSVSREYLYFPDGRLMAEADGAGNIVREYAWMDDLPLAAVDVSGSSSTLYYIHAGHRGEPLAMTDASKAKVWDASVSPFGAATIFTATTPLDLRLPGQQLQAETGLHQNYMRDYDPALGRYAEPDPIGLNGGPNVYSYVGQDPLNYVDPDGEFLFPLIIPVVETAPAWVPVVIQFALEAAVIAHITTSSASNDSNDPQENGQCPIDDDPCLKQYKRDMNRCGQNYSFNPSAYRGCIARAASNLVLCQRGEDQLPTWNDVDVDGVRFPQPPRRPRRR